MMRRWLGVVLLLACVLTAEAHVGSPDIFFEGVVGPYPAHVTIRMPSVVPGRAEISVRVLTTDPVQVFFQPFYSRTAVTNAPPPDLGTLIRGETNLYTGQLWLMSFGGYSIQVKLRGPAGEGSVEIPVNSVAFRQLPLPASLKIVLCILGALLVFGGLAIVMGATREASLPPGTLANPTQRRWSWFAGIVTLFIFTLTLTGGRNWWRAEEKNFRGNLMEGGWPDMSIGLRVTNSQRLLDLSLGDKAFDRRDSITLVPDHGKLLHLFLIRENDEAVFAHLHPVRIGGKTFETPLPPLPPGRYKVLCDLTLESSGLSSTATNSIELSAAPVSDSKAIAVAPDADDSYVISAGTNFESASSNLTYHLPTGENVTWLARDSLRAGGDAQLNFLVTDATGRAVHFEPYMGMTGHAVVMRNDGGVFTHLHPGGNFSMAAMDFFQNKITRETGVASTVICGIPGATNSFSLSTNANAAASVITFPYEFPAAGDYHIWVQFKIDGAIKTAVFAAPVAGPGR